MMKKFRLEFNDIPVRIRVDEQNTLWFATKDICLCLNILNRDMMLLRLDNTQKSTQQQIHYISESAINSPFISQKPLTEAFKQWIEQTVLPTVQDRLSKKKAIPRDKPALVQAENELASIQAHAESDQVHQLALQVPIQSLKPFLSVKDFAQMMNVSKNSVKWWVSRKYVPSFTIGHRRFINIIALQQQIAKSTNET